LGEHETRTQRRRRKTNLLTSILNPPFIKITTERTTDGKLRNNYFFSYNLPKMTMARIITDIKYKSDTGASFKDIDSKQAPPGGDSVDGGDSGFDTVIICMACAETPLSSVTVKITRYSPSLEYVCVTFTPLPI
jgi:hypothetical protein